MKKDQIRVILDTNLWISFLISKKLTWLDQMLCQSQIGLLFSHELFAEFLTVAHRPKLKEFFTPTDINHLLELIEPYSTLINVSSCIEKCRDPKDNFLLNLAIDGQADYLVTGDLELLELETIENTIIMDLAEFKSIIQKQTKE